jgi:hypothetical protein
LTTTKSYLNHLNAVTATTTSTAQDLSSVDGCKVNYTLTNGGTAPTTAGTLKIEVANDYNAGSPHQWVNLATLSVSNTASAVLSGSIRLDEPDAAVHAIWTASSGGTATTCTVDTSTFTVT